MRLILFDRWGAQLRTVTDVSSVTWAEELNGEDTLEIVTGCELVKGERVVWCDRQGLWHEHTVASVTVEHSGGAPAYAATCENSISELYGDWVADRRPSGSAALALSAALETSRWEVGEVTVEGSHSVSLYRTSAREAVQAVVEKWGGELSTTIVVSGAEVVARLVNLTRRGSDNGRRFTYGHDMSSIRRTVDAGDVVTALYGFGKGEEVGDGHGRGIDFADINGGRQYVEDLDALELWGRPDGEGGKAHVFGKFEAQDCDDPAELLELTEAELDRRKEPRVSYEASVAIFASYGYDFSGVAIGDDVALADDADGVSFRARGRVTRLVQDLLDGGRPTDLTIGNIVEGVDGILAGQYADLRSLVERATGWDVAAYTPSPYIQQIMDGLNRVFDAGASYVYQSPSQGVIVASVPLDPSDGTPVSLPASAIQLKGGGFRIANSLKGDGSWDWRTFGTGDGFVADCIVSGNLLADLITTGTITDRAGTNYWDLDSGEFRLSAGATVGGDTVQEIASAAADSALDSANAYTDALDQSLDQEAVFDRLTGGGETQGIYLTDGRVYVNGTFIRSGTIDASLVRAGTISDAAGSNFWDLETGELSMSAGATLGGKTAQEYADGALSDAMEYADEVGSSALDSANAYTDALDQSLGQEAVFDRLTGGGETQGIYMTDGNLYLNGSFVRSGTLDANLLRTGRIQGRSGSSYWDLDTGELQLDFAPEGMVTEDWVSEQIGDASSSLSAQLSSQISSVNGRINSTNATVSSLSGRVTTAANNASSAKSKTDRITFTSDGIRVTGTSGTQRTVATYNSEGMIYDSNLAGIATRNAKFTIKDWGIVFQGEGNENSDIQFWVSRNSDAFLIKCPSFEFQGDANGVYHNGRKLAFA